LRCGREEIRRTSTGEEEIAHLSVTGSKDDLRALAAQIVEEAARRLKKRRAFDRLRST
jgi:hypothetical protein